MARKLTQKSAQKEDPNKAILDEAKDRFKMVLEHDYEFRKHAIEDLKFYSGDQWEAKTKVEREMQARPCLIFNQLPSFIKQITNEIRQTNMAIQVDPTGSQGEADTANVISGLIKHVEQQSNADSAYDKAAFDAVTIGEGFIRILAKHVDDNSFDQELFIKPIHNPLNVFLDPNSKEPDGSDAEFCFITEDIPQEEYTRLYGDSKLAEQAKVSGWKDFYTDQWIEAGMVRVAEYFYKEYKTKTIYHVYDPDMVTEMVLADGTKPTDKQEVLNTRKVEVCTIKHLKINGEEVLEESIWPGCYIPVVPVKGEEFWLEGKKFKRGALRDLRDAQRVYNFHKSAEVEVANLAPKAPFVIATGQIDGHEREWADANNVNFGYLTYNPVDLNGTVIGAPQRSTAEPPIQALSVIANEAKDDMKSISGIYDASLGANGNENSGKAILARQQQSSTSNFDYVDNLKRSIRHIGRIIVNVIPVFYDTVREIRIVKPNGQAEMIAINKLNDDGKTFDMTLGKYDVNVDTGASFATRRQEAAEAMMTLGQAFPSALPAIADLITTEMDWPNAQEITKRLHAMVPPQVLQATGEEGEQASQEQVQQLTQQLQQAQATLQKMQADLHLMQQQAQLSKMELDIAHHEAAAAKIQAKMDLEKAKSDREIELRKLQLQEETTVLEFQVKAKELDLQEAQLAIKAKIDEAKVAITGAQAMSAIAESHHEHTVDHIDRMTADVVPMDDDLEVENDPSEVNPTGDDALSRNTLN